MTKNIENTILSFEDFASLAPEETYAYLVKIYQNFSDELQNKDHLITLLRHQIYGRKSEKSKTFSEQPVLSGFENIFDEAPDADEEPDAEEQEDQTEKQQETEKQKRKKPGRKPLPDHLPREKVIHDLKESDKQCPCGHGLHKIGEETSEQIKYIPAQVKIIQHVRYKYACKACENTVKTAPVPAQPIPKSIATPSLLAQVFISKFDDHLPLYRQSEIWRRIGVDLNRATLSNWVIKAGKLCYPLVKLLQSHIVTGSYVQADETPVTMLKKSSKPRQKSYMWVYRTGYDPKVAIVYDFQENREGKNATEFLKGFKGHLQGDAYSGYNNVTRPIDVIRVGCMAHARRKFVDVINMAPNKKGYAHQAVEKIKALYEIERHMKERGFLPDDVKNYREKHAKPLLDSLKTWLDELKPKAPPKGPLGRAISYSLNQWDELTRYLEDGCLAIDNNACERAIKPFTVGRKNWLFVGNQGGGQGGAVLYSLIETAKANGIEPYQYLCHVLEKIPQLSGDELHQLLPWNCPTSLQDTFKQAA